MLEMLILGIYESMKVMMNLNSHILIVQVLRGKQMQLKKGSMNLFCKKSETTFEKEIKRNRGKLTLEKQLTKKLKLCSSIYCSFFV